MVSATYLLAGGALSACLTALICSFGPRIATAARLMARPDGERRLHAEDTPIVGGIGVLLPVLLISAVYVVFLAHQDFMPTAIAAAAAMFLVGIVDDRADISSGWRFVALSYIVFCAFSFQPDFVIHTLRFQYSHVDINIPLDPIAAPFTAFMILGLVNASNMADGMNGQLLGSVFIWSAFIVHRMGAEAGLPFFLLMCSVAVALMFNLRDKLFSGSAGAYALTMFVALGAIANYRSAHGTMHADTPVFWFWLPVVDCLRLLVLRLMQGRAPTSADRSHFHHILLGMMRTRYAIPFYLLLLATPGALAELNEAWGKFGLLIGGSLYVLLILRSVYAARTLAVPVIETAAAAFSSLATEAALPAAE
jgi:UDP-GlcNAc:undecaprenyl-phosphate GlcNAc-1-phosphate transferase